MVKKLPCKEGDASSVPGQEAPTLWDNEAREPKLPSLCAELLKPVS